MLTLDHVQIAIPAGREAEARAFYGRCLGLTELEKPEPLRARGGCWFALGDRQLHLGVDPDFRAARKAHVAFATPDLEQLRERLREDGRPLISDAPLAGPERFFSEDPFGNRLEFIGSDEG